MSDEATYALDVAEAVADTLAQRSIRTVLIGAAAMAVHGYPRATQDIDLATVGVPIPTLHAVADDLRRAGYTVEVREPDAADPLGGLVRVDASPEVQVDVVNFGNPWTQASRAVGTLALDAPSVRLGDRRLFVVDLIVLVVLKLSAGSRFDLRDAAELLARNPDLDRTVLQTHCVALRLDRKLARVLEDVADQDTRPVE